MSFIVTRSRSKLGLGENIAKDPVQSDSQRETVRETPASDSDSGDSLFLTQSVTSPSRTVRRHRPCNDPACPLSQESVDVQEKAGGQNAQHKDTRMSSDSDSEATYAVLLRRWKLLADSRGSFSQPPRPTRKRVSPKWMGVPFLKKSSSVCKKQTIVNSEVGGFFKCMLKLSKGHGDKRRGELSPSLLLSAQEEISMQTEDDDDDDDEDVRKVDLDCFIQNTHKRNQQTWLPSLKWKTRRAPGTCTEKSNKCQEEQETCYQIRKVAEDLMAPQDDTDVYNESSSLNIEVSRSMKKVEKSSKSPEWNWMEPIDEMSDDETQWPKLVDQDEDETQILQDNPTDREGSQDALCLENSSCEHQVQVEDICQGVHHEPLENETQILQDNPTDREGRDDALCLENISSCEHPVQVEDIRQGVHHEPLENETQILQDNPTDREGREDALCLENISFCEHQVQVEHIRQGVHHEPLENETQILQDEMSDDETQWPNLVDQDEDETQILQDNPTDREGSEDALCLENISSCEHQVQVKDIHQCVHHEPLENEDLGNVGGGFIGSQDLFQEPNNQASPLKEISVENDKEVLESRVVPHDDIDLIIQKKKSSLILADMEVDVLKYFKSLRTHPSEIVSPTAGDICQVRQEKDKTTLGMHDPHHHSSLPLEDYKSGSIGNDYSSHSKDILMVRQEEKAETPLFNFGGLKFLKRKYKKTKDPEISDNLAPRLADLGQNEYSALHFDDVKRKNRRKVKNDWLLEEPVDTLPDVSVAADSGLSVQDSSVVCASVSGSKPKKKRKKDKNYGLLEEPVDTLPDVSVAADSGLSVQDSSVVCASVSGSKPKKKRKKVKTDRLLGELVDTLPDVSVAADSGLSVQDSSLVCASLNGIKPKKKRKKDKHGQPAPQEDEWIGVEEAIQIPCQGSASLVSIAEEIKQPIRTDLSNFVQSDCLEPQRKKKRVKKKQDSSPMISDEIVALQCSEESYSSHGIKTVKKKKKTLTDVGEGQIGEMVTATKNIGEPLEKIPEITAGIEIQPVNSINLTDDSVTPRKKRKKRKRQKVVIEENMDVEALLVETTEQVETPDTQDSEQQGAEVVLLRKQKKKKDRTETRQEEEASKNESLSLRLGLVEMTTSNTPSTRSETVGIGEEEGLDGSEPVKKRRELENYGSWSVSHSLLYLDQYRWQNSKQTRMVKEASSSGQNDTNERNKCERTKGDHSESSQQVLQSEDTIQPNGKKKKKKKKKKLVETDIEVYPEIVEHEVCQESGSPSETSEAIIEKKKKNRKDTVDRGGNQSLDVVPKLCAAEEPRDVLVTCHAKKDNISSSGGALLVHIKKKKQVRDPDNDLDATLGAEKVAVSGKSNQCSQTHSAKLKKKRKRDHL